MKKILSFLLVAAMAFTLVGATTVNAETTFATRGEVKSAFPKVTFLGYGDGRSVEETMADPITRAQAITLLVRAEKYPVATKDYFTDDNGHWAEAAINAAAEQGLIVGYGNNVVGPDDRLTIEQVGIILERLKEETPTTPTPPPTTPAPATPAPVEPTPDPEGISQENNLAEAEAFRQLVSDAKYEIDPVGTIEITTYTLKYNSEVKSNVTIPAYTTLDLGGKTLTIADGKTLTIAENAIVQNGEIKNGTIALYGELTADKATSALRLYKNGATTIGGVDAADLFTVADGYVEIAPANYGEYIISLNGDVKIEDLAGTGISATIKGTGTIEDGIFTINGTLKMFDVTFVGKVEYNTKTDKLLVKSGTVQISAAALEKIADKTTFTTKGGVKFEVTVDNATVRKYNVTGSSADEKEIIFKLNGGAVVDGNIVTGLNL